jgi:ribose transport system substrate-binding protein
MFTFGIIGKSNNNPVFQAARQGAEDAAKELSQTNNVQITVDWRTPDQEDGQKQANNVEQFMLAHVDGIGISCSNASLVTNAINTAVDAGIPVMCWDSDAPNSKRFCYHGVDNFECGHQVMTELAKVMDGKGVVAILAGNQTATNLQERVRGAKAAKEKYPGMTIKETYYHAEDTQSAAAKVEEVQTANPDIQGWAMIGGWPLFSDAIRKSPKFAGGKIKIVAVDALPECLPYIREGVAQELLAQGVYQWGYRAVEILYDKVVNGKVPFDGKDISTLLPVTKANIDEYAKNWEKWLAK